MRCENFALYHNKRLFRADPCRSVIKEFAHAFSCAFIKLWMHLESLERTQKARVAFGCASSYSFTFFVLSKPRTSITRYTLANHEQILNFSTSYDHNLQCPAPFSCRSLAQSSLQVQEVVSVRRKVGSEVKVCQQLSTSLNKRHNNDFTCSRNPHNSHLCWIACKGQMTLQRSIFFLP